ncbi:STAS domain-containing protein [Catenuloplanes japonicus]|uniref:STAS domain-containing protein n=1 Tax=Catenuloplanes japonicus TaxID=33876 RepID=UPI000524AFE0|nr:STAS domain-containing protein [Catenuloplanes japonicus]
MTDLVLRQSGRPDELTIHVAGEIDGATAPTLEQALLKALASAPRRLLIDAAEVTFCDSRGIAAFVAAWRAATTTSLSLRPSPRLRRVLTLSGIDTLLDLI